jgi:hypothetical protein
MEDYRHNPFRREPAKPLNLKDVDMCPKHPHNPLSISIKRWNEYFGCFACFSDSIDPELVKKVHYEPQVVDGVDEAEILEKARKKEEEEENNDDG